MKYIKAIEKKEKYQREIIGVEIQTTKEVSSIIGVDLRDQNDIDIFELNKKDYNFKVIDKDAVEHFFSVAILELKNDLNKSEISLKRANRNLCFGLAKYKQYFGEFK